MGIKIDYQGQSNAHFNWLRKTTGQLVEQWQALYDYL